MIGYGQTGFSQQNKAVDALIWSWINNVVANDKDFAKNLLSLIKTKHEKISIGHFLPCANPRRL